MGNGSQLTHSRDSNGGLSGLPLLQRGLGFSSSLLNFLGVLFVCPSLLRCLDLEMGGEMSVLDPVWREQPMDPFAYHFRAESGVIGMSVLVVDVWVFNVQSVS